MTKTTSNTKRRAAAAPAPAPAIQRPALATVEVRSYDLGKYRLVNVQDTSIWRGDNEKGWQREDTGPLTVLIQHAAGQVGHLNGGSCPDAVEGAAARDANCPVCKALIALGHGAAE